MRELLKKSACARVGRATVEHDDGRVHTQWCYKGIEQQLLGAEAVHNEREVAEQEGEPLGEATGSHAELVSRRHLHVHQRTCRRSELMQCVATWEI